MWQQIHLQKSIGVNVCGVTVVNLSITLFFPKWSNKMPPETNVERNENSCKSIYWNHWTEL
jgi:hypothetical protein